MTLSTIVNNDHGSLLDNQDNIDGLENPDKHFILTIPGQLSNVMVTVTDMDTLTRVAFILTIHGQPWMVSS